MAILKQANFSGTNGSHYTMRLDYSLKQNQTANTSEIIYSLYFITDRYGSGYGTPIKGYINGAEVGSCSSISTNSTILIGTKKENVTHNNDGTKSVDYSASMSSVWTGLGSSSLSGTLTLPKIDRLAILDESSLPTLITDESSISFSYSNPANFKVKPVITITQDSMMSIEGDYITASPYTWNWLTTTTNKNLVYDCVRNSPNATAKLKLNTYDSNDNYIGTTMSAASIPFTLVNSSPIISIVCSEQNTKVKNIVGNELILLNNASSLKVDATVTTKKNATVLEVLIQDKKVSSPYSTTYTVSKEDTTNYKINASVRDSRQLISTVTSSTYQLIDYQPVSIDSYKFKRENPTSSVIKLTAEITYWSVTLNGTANIPTISYSVDGSNYVTIPSSAYTINNTNHTITINNYKVANLDYRSQGTYYLKVADKFTEDIENDIVTKGIPTTEKGKDVFQINGRLIIADENRQNPVSVLEKLNSLVVDNLDSEETDKAPSTRAVLQAITPTVVTDANGWTLINYGTHKEYIKNIDTSVTVAGNGWGAVEISNFPVGMTELGNRNLTFAGGCLDNAVDISVLTPRDWGSVWIGYRNKYSGQVTGNVNLCLRILELPEM